ncbi:hypothetical protein [Pectinatus frisingensis]|uniref:hypothetical protein n=1 Tax=Pectinatus frisingensis TaxID=865 RepID=UPI0018C7C670|nr:hypothetical protein [Pectinatus frisingensis]
MIPTKIKILGHEYHIIFDNDYIEKSGGNTGQCNNYRNEIHICSKLPESSQNEILIHEIIEALDYRLELNLEHHKICALGESLNQVLCDNGLH